MRSISSAGKKQGVSLWRNCGGSPHSFSRMPRKRRYFSGDHWSLNWRRYEGIKKKGSAVHDLHAVDPDVESAPHNVDMRRGIPVRTGMRAVGIPKSDMDARNLLVLENVPDHVAHPDIGADGELAHAIAV